MLPSKTSRYNIPSLCNAPNEQSFCQQTASKRVFLMQIRQVEATVWYERKEIRDIHSI